MNNVSAEVLSGQLLWHCYRSTYFGELGLPVHIITEEKFLPIPNSLRRKEVYRIREEVMGLVFSLRELGFPLIILDVSSNDELRRFWAPSPKMGQPSSFIFHPPVIDESGIKLNLDLYEQPSQKVPHTFSLADIRRVSLSRNPL